MKPIWIGIQGGTCAGKTTFANHLATALGSHDSLIICLDAFFKPYDRKANAANITAHNFDHPSSLDWIALEAAMLDLDSGKRVQIPVFEYETGFRLPGRDVDPRQYVIVEGLWPFFNNLLLDLFSIRVFVETPENHRLSRLLLRVGGDRGWTLESVLEYYLKCSRPMQTEFIDKGKSITDIIVNGDAPFDSGVRWVLRALKTL